MQVNGGQVCQFSRARLASEMFVDGCQEIVKPGVQDSSDGRTYAYIDSPGHASDNGDVTAALPLHSASKR
eukprot:SAG31_NODE_40547_length_280_cov_0.701657_1_plen_69_part_01